MKAYKICFDESCFTSPYFPIELIVFAKTRSKARWTVVKAQCEAYKCTVTSVLRKIRSVNRDKEYDKYYERIKEYNIEGLTLSTTSWIFK